MARSYRPVDRDQEFLMPPSLREWLPADHLVWFVLQVVDELDTTQFRSESRLGRQGRAPFDPDLLLAVLIYAYAVGERSSRRIESLCRDHVAFQVLCGRDVPDHTVISRFRATHEDRFADVFAQVLAMCASAGMVKVGTVAIDGTVIAADASIFANRGEDSLRDEATRIAAQITSEAAAVDAAEDEQYGNARGDELAPEFANPATRAAAIKAALAELENDKKRRAAQDIDEAERRAQVWDERLGRAREELSALVADLRARAAAWDAARAGCSSPDTSPDTSRPRGPRPSPDNASVRRLRARIVRLEERLAATLQGAPGTGAGSKKTQDKQAKVRRRANVTDPESRIMNTRTGWVQGYNAQLAVTDDHLILALMLTQSTDMAWLVPMMNAATTAATDLATGPIGTVLADAGYCSEYNLTAPGPDRIIATGKDRRLTDEAATDPRQGPAPAGATALEQMRHRTRTPEGLTAYKRRGALVEPVNGHLKDQTGLRRFSRRGLTAATSELNLAATVVNLLKLHHYRAATA